MKKKRFKTLDIVLLCVFCYMIYLNHEMMQIFREHECVPETVWCALIAALIGECGICGWIRASKNKYGGGSTDLHTPDAENEDHYTIDEEERQ